MPNPEKMLRVITTILPALLIALSLAAPPPARANPHVWVEAWVVFEFEDYRLKGLAFTWRFDEYYSSHTIQSYDRDGDGFIVRPEMRVLRAGMFDPLGESDYHVHVWAGGVKRQGHEIDRFTARIVEKRLVIDFSVPVAPPADPSEDPVVVSLLDHKNEVDFGFAPTGFLRVMGALKPGCKFTVALGKGEQAGHPRPVTLKCGA